MVTKFEKASKKRKVLLCAELAAESNIFETLHRVYPSHVFKLYNGPEVKEF
jgi:hypothetical protein